jgi:hypothetical protein
MTKWHGILNPSLKLKWENARDKTFSCIHLVHMGTRQLWLTLGGLGFIKYIIDNVSCIWHTYQKP